MNLKQHEIAYGAVAGGLIGLAYIVGSAWWSNDWSGVTIASLGGAAAVGAVAGILAFVVRGSAEEK